MEYMSLRLVVLMILYSVFLYGDPITRLSFTAKIISMTDSCSCLSYDFDDYDLGVFSYIPCRNYDSSLQKFTIIKSSSLDKNACDNFYYYIKTKTSQGFKKYTNANSKTKEYQEFEIIEYDILNSIYIIKLLNESLCLTYSNASSISYTNLFLPCIQPAPLNQRFKIINYTSKHIIDSIKIKYLIEQYNESGYFYTSHHKFYLYLNQEPFTRYLLSINKDLTTNTIAETTVSNIEAGEYEVYQYGFDSPIDLLDLNYCTNFIPNKVLTNTVVRIRERTRNHMDYSKNFKYPCQKCKNYYSNTVVIENNNFDFLMLNANCPTGSAINSLVFDFYEDQLLLNYRCFFSSKITNLCKVVQSASFDKANLAALSDISVNCLDPSYIMKSLNFVKIDSASLKLVVECCQVIETNKIGIYWSRIVTKVDIADQYAFSPRSIKVFNPIDGGYNGGIYYIKFIFESYCAAVNFEYKMSFFDDLNSEMLGTDYNKITQPIAWPDLKVLDMAEFPMICNNYQFLSSTKQRKVDGFNWAGHVICVDACVNITSCNVSCNDFQTSTSYTFPSDSNDFENIFNLKVAGSDTDVIKSILPVRNGNDLYLRFQKCFPAFITEECYYVLEDNSSGRITANIDRFISGGNGPNQAMSFFNYITSFVSANSDLYHFACSAVIN